MSSSGESVKIEALPTQYVAKMFICLTHGEYGSGQTDIMIISYDIIQLSSMKVGPSWDLGRIQTQAKHILLDYV